MGAGNPSLRSFDPDRYEPTTFFVDFTSDYQDYLHCCEDEPPISEDSFYEQDNDLSFESFFNMITCYDGRYNSIRLDWKDLMNGKHKTYEELSFGYRKEGVVLLETDYMMVITETGSDSHHIPFAIIPNFRYEVILDEICEQRNLDYNDSRAIFHADGIYRSKMRQFVLHERDFWRYILRDYPTIDEYMSVRDGAWTSSKLDVEALKQKYKIKRISKRK